jgi:hypothetical protein
MLARTLFPGLLTYSIVEVSDNGTLSDTNLDGQTRISRCGRAPGGSTQRPVESDV